MFSLDRKEGMKKAESFVILCFCYLNSFDICLYVCLSRLVLLCGQVCLLCPSSPERSRGAAPAATGRSGIASCCRPWTGTGTRTVWSVPAVTAAWAGWALHSTPGPTSSSAVGTIWGNPNSSTGGCGLWEREEKKWMKKSFIQQMLLLGSSAQVAIH